MMKEVLLLDLAHARSGDKGDAGNVGVIARREEYYSIIRDALTTERVAEHFQGICNGPVERFELPNLWALNFLLHNTLGGGGTVSLKFDAQGKTLSSAMLRMKIEVPDELEVTSILSEDIQPTMTQPTARPLKEEALEFFLAENVLRFGEFTLKSGRSSPYFFNTGLLSDGRQLATLGVLYGRAILELENYDEIDVIFGSAYKGIPISVATAIWLSFERDGRPLRALSDRKEKKGHGDSGSFLGVVEAGSKAVIVDDVITDGATKKEAIGKLREAGIEPVALVIAFDRQEPVVPGGPTAVAAFSEEIGIPVVSLLSVDDVIEARPEQADILRNHIASFEQA